MTTPRVSHDEIAAMVDAIPFSSVADREFLRRVYSTPAQVYADRLRRLGFARRTSVLDAGSGYGQWSLALAGLNERVTALEFGAQRTEVTAMLGRRAGVANLHVVRGRLEHLPFECGEFDAVFSYLAIYFTDLHTTLREIARVMRPGGLFYLSANDVGWYVGDLIEGRHSTPDQSTRRAALSAIVRGISFALGSHRGGEKFVPISTMRRALHDRGFREIRSAGEGRLNAAIGEAPPFFAQRRYGFPAVYEILSTR